MNSGQGEEKAVVACLDYGLTLFGMEKGTASVWFCSKETYPLHNPGYNTGSISAAGMQTSAVSIPD